jgi:hypothetical protein
MQLRITGPRAEALRFALDLAAQDQREYIHHGHPERDHGEEWPEAAQRKAKQFRQLADIAERIGEDALARSFRELATDATTHADYHARQRAEIQRRTQAPPYYRGPDTPPAFRDGAIEDTI